MTKRLREDPIENHMYRIPESSVGPLYDDQEEFGKNLIHKLKDISFDLDRIGEFEAAAAIGDLVLRRMPDMQMSLGCARWYYELRKYKKSLKYLEFALNNDPQNPEIRLNYARVLYFDKQADKSLEIMNELVEEHPQLLDDDQICVDYSMFKSAVGDVKGSMECLDKLPSGSEEGAQFDFNRGWHYFSFDQFKKGFQHIDRGRPLNVWGNFDVLEVEAKISPNDIWKRGEKVDTIAYYLEGGVGDEFIFLRYVNYWKQYCNTLKIFCNKNIRDLLIECGYENVYTRDEIPFHYVDKVVPAMSAPLYGDFDTPKDHTTFPYLVRTPDKNSPAVKKMREIAGDKKKVIIKWAGNPDFEHEQFRVFPLEYLLELEKLNDKIQIFHVQLEHNEGLPKNSSVYDLTEYIDDWRDTYDIFDEADIVISSCTSTAHLAAAMGKRSCVILPIVPYFCWASDKDVWYEDNLTLCKQTKYGDEGWKEAIDKAINIVEEELCQ